MPSLVTAVMYHYVRDCERSRYPRIHALSTDHFRGQLAFFRRHYTLITAKDLIAATDGAELPPRALLLTFDDGFADHYTTVFPLLDECGATGAFFPPAACIEEHRVLDVNKIHFVLASEPDTLRLLDHVFEAIRKAPPELALKTPEEYRATVDCSSRWDTPDVMLLKKLLQRELPESFRATVIDSLFTTYVSADEAAFAHELYMTPDQVKTMVRHGMYIGNHGHGHVWMNRLDAEGQREEIQRGLAFMERMGMSTERWLVNYPYGGFDDQLLQLLKASNCVAGFSVRVGIADLANDHPLLLPRLNTNDLPVEAGAAPNEWVTRAVADQDAHPGTPA